MKIQTRKIAEKVEYLKDEVTGKEYKYVTNYENGYVEEQEIELNDISTFSKEKNTRIIGIGKNLYLLTLKSWKEVKNTLEKSGLMYKFNFEKKS